MDLWQEQILLSILDHLDSQTLRPGMSDDVRPEHCWHDVGLIGMAYPPQISEVCCHCGAKRIRKHRRPAGHGPFMPVDALTGETYYTFQNGIDEVYCPRAPQPVR